MALFISDALAESRQKVSFYDENDYNHPSDYSFHAFMKEDQIKAMALEEQRQIYAEGTKVHSGYVFPLMKVSVNLFSKVLPYKIYDKLDWETEKPVLLEHWADFAKKARADNEAKVVYGCFLQNPLCETMMRFNFSYPVIRDYISEINNIISPLKPVVIYLKCTDIESRIEKKAPERKRGWLKGAIEYHTSQGYGKRHGLSGFNGFIACLEERQRIELEIMDELNIDKLILSDPFDNWEAAYEKINELIKGKMQKVPAGF